MELITKELEEVFLKFPFGSQEGKGMKAKVIVKYFAPVGSATWLVTEAEKNENGDWELFGYAKIHDWEWGYALLSELQEIKLPFGLGIERDLYLDDDDTVESCI